MSVITARGQQVQDSINSKKIDLKEVYIRLKDGDSGKVRVLGLYDYVEYKAHGSFTHGIYTQPCIAVTGKECPLCKAANSGEEGFDVLYAKKRYVFALGDLATGTIKVWDCSKNQAKALIEQINEYKDDIDTLAFNFKRTGTKTETTFSLNPIIRLTGDDAEKFSKFDGVKVEDELFEQVLQARSEELMLKVLDAADFPMEKHFPNFVRETTEGSNGLVF